MKYEIQIVKDEHNLSVQYIRDGKVLDTKKMFHEDQFLFLGLLAEAHNDLADNLISGEKSIKFKF